MLTENWLFWGSALLYDVIVMSYVGCLLILYVWKDQTQTYTMVPIGRILEGCFSFQVHKRDLGVVTTPRGKPLIGVQIQILTSAHGIESPLKSELDNSTEILFL